MAGKEASLTQLAKEGLLFRLIYSFYNIAMPFYFMFINIYFRRLGFTGVQIGLLNVLYYVMNFLFQPIWGYLSDTYNAKRPIMLLLALVSAGTMLAYTTTGEYTRIIVIIAVLGTSFNAIMPILDASALDYVERSGVAYGSIRLWGSVGFVLAGLVIGQITERFGIKAIFPAAAGVLLLLFAISLGLPRGQRVPKADKAESSGFGKIQGQMIRKLLTERRFAAFLISAFLMQASMAMGFGFLNIYMAQVGATDAFIGYAWAAAGMSEIVAFIFLARLQRRFGAKMILFLAYSVMTARWVLYMLVRTPLAFLPVQLMQGVSVGLFFAGGVTYVQEEAPPELKATAQTIFGAVNMGLGPIAGMSAGGYLLDIFGLPNLFIFCAIASLANAVFFGTFLRTEQARQAKAALN